jgi:iron complex transport system substrate-binding protein
MMSTSMRIVSLIPSATEILVALGLELSLVGRSHECDYPAGVQVLPVCTEPKFDPKGTSREIHDRVTALLQSALSVYRVNAELLEQLQPTHIVTQAQCEVCAVSLGEVEQAVASLITSQPQIISLQPNTLEDVWTDFQRVGEALGVEWQPVMQVLRSRLHTCQQQVQALPKHPTVACIEWTDPLMAAGNWIPELVTLAGGQSLFGVTGQHSPWLQWDAIADANPDVIIFMPCGYTLDQTHQDAQKCLLTPEWQRLNAVKTNQVYITDGNQYFNRPGPRLADSLEILVEILHPETCKSRYQYSGWQNISLTAEV